MKTCPMVMILAFTAWTQAGAAVSQQPAALDGDRLEKLWKSIESPAGRYSTRSFFSFALEAAAAGWHPERVETALRHAATKQDRDPASKTYGNLAWYWEDELPVDRNCVQFCMQTGILLRMHFHDRLTAAARATLDEIVRYAVEGIRLHRVSPSYTNIYLKKTWNCIAIGETAGRADLAEEGYAMLDTWLAHTRTNGVCEYLSPTYAAVDVANVGLIVRHARNPEARRKAGLAMDFLWTELAAHWFPPAGRLGGPHSRDYDYLRGVGGINPWAERAGWPSAPGSASDKPYLDAACWVPPQETASALPGRTPRMVRGRFGAEPWRSLAQWVGRRIALGSAGAAYLDAMDKTLVVLFEGMERPTCSFLMDARLDPYGTKKYPTGGGHNKAHHVFPFLASVQRGGEALLLASATTEGRSQAFRRSGTNLTCMLSHVVLPSDVRLYVGPTGRSLPAGIPMRLPSPGTPVFLRDGDAAAAFRFVMGTTPEGVPAPVEIVEDGGAWKARRLTCVHSILPPAGRTTVAVWARVAEGLDDPGFAAFRKPFADASAAIVADGPAIDITVQGVGGVPLRLKADLDREERLANEGAEHGAYDALLTVDGAELGVPLIDRALGSP